MIDINLKSLLNVINSIVVSLRPSINQMLQNGIVIDLSKITKQYGLNRVDAKVFLDYVAAGLRFDLWSPGFSFEMEYYECHYFIW